MIAFLDAYRASLFSARHNLSNLISGIVVGVVALPLAMAFAIASGAKPEQGLYTAIVAGIAVSLFGGSRVQIAGPTGAFIVILAGITAQYGIEGLLLATLMAGIILVLMGITKLGSLIKFIPSPVIVGFTAGISVIIWVGQWKDFFGLNPTKLSGHIHEDILPLIQSFQHLHLATTCLALLSLFLTLYSSRILKKIPGPLTAMLVATGLQAYFQFEGVATIGSAFGGIPQTLPSFKIPSIDLLHLKMLIGPAFTIAMLGAIESLLSAVVADGMAGTRHNPNQELIGQGIANILTPLFGGFAATGAIARTATNIRNGGTSPLSGVIHALTLLFIILLLAPYASHIPLCSLSAILFVVAYNMSDHHHFFSMIKRAPRSDVGILLITFMLTVFTDLVVAVNIGVILSTLLFMGRIAKTVQVKQEDLSHLPEIPKDVIVYAIEGPFFFAAVEAFEQALVHTHTEPKTIIIRLKQVPYIDITGLQTLEEVIISLQKMKTRILLCEINHNVFEKLHRAKIIDLIGRDNILDHLESALQKASVL